MNNNIFNYIDNAIRRYPDVVAIADDQNKITYFELSQKIQTITMNLKTHIKYGDSVIIYLSRGISYITLMLSLIKIGVTYTPLEKQTPIYIVKKMAEEINAKCIITDEQIDFLGVSVLLLKDVEAKDKFTSIKMHAAELCEPKLDDPVYIIYTSGSSGNPKGVIIEHRNLINLIRSLEARIYYPLVKKRPCRIAVMASFSFDSSVKQIFMALCNGHTLVICPANLKKMGRLAIDFLRRNQVDVVDMTPSLIELFSLDPKMGKYEDLSVLLLGGEILRGKHVEQARNMFGDKVNIVNLYGPTECCVDVAYYIIPSNINMQKQNDILPIGIPLENIHFYVDNENGGELIIEGECVGRGYTSAYKNSFDQTPTGNRRYRTGDVCRVDSMGLYYICGRLDNQIKYHGYRIELDAIDNKIMQMNSDTVSFSFYTNCAHGSYIYTFVKTSLDVSYIRTHLEQELPRYMMPTIIRHIEGTLRLNANGKVDKLYYKKIMIEDLKGPH